MRRATSCISAAREVGVISIHALHEESDLDSRAVFDHLRNNFNPRSP